MSNTQLCLVGQLSFRLAIWANLKCLNTCLFMPNVGRVYKQATARLRLARSGLNSVFTPGKNIFPNLDNAIMNVSWTSPTLKFREEQDIREGQ